MPAGPTDEVPALPAAAGRALAVPPDLLDLPPEQMRSLGHHLVDLVVDHLTGLDQRPALSLIDADTLREVLGGPLPAGGSDLRAQLDLLAQHAVPAQQHGDHPRYFARVPGPSSFAGILGEWLAVGTQTIASSWGGGSGPTIVELIATEWLRDALGLDPHCEGVLQSGGSLANLTALLTARHHAGPGVVYLSDQTHASIRRDLTAIGWPADEVRVIPVDPPYSLTAAAVTEAMVQDIAAGHRPAVVIATAGTTNTGAVDDLPGLADLSAEQGGWLHVDGAYGAPAAMTPRGRAALAGLERADSVVVDPHKWLFQPYDLACVLVRHPGALERTFAMHPEYLADVQSGDVNLHNRSLELTRRGRAFKLWLTFRTYGVTALADAVDRGLGLAEYAQHTIEAHPDLCVVTPASLGIVTFRHPGATDADHRRAAADLTASGYAAVTTTLLADRTVLRLCTINPRTTTDDIDGTIARLANGLAG